MYREAWGPDGDTGHVGEIIEKDPHAVDIAALKEMRQQMLEIAARGEIIDGQRKIAGGEKVPGGDREIEAQLADLTEQYKAVQGKFQAKLKAMNDMRRELDLGDIQEDEPTDAEIKEAAKKL